MPNEEDELRKHVSSADLATRPNLLPQIKQEMKERKQKDLAKLKATVDRRNLLDQQKKDAKGVGGFKKEKVETADEKADPKKQILQEKMKAQAEKQSTTEKPSTAG